MSFDPNADNWNSEVTTRRILGGDQKVVPATAAKVCWNRMRVMRDQLRDLWCGFDNAAWGWLTDWVIACIIAREHVLLLGRPGVGKNEIATQLFHMLGLSAATVDDVRANSRMDASNPYTWWKARSEAERAHQKYFHYQLSRFTQIEELFGPVEISLLRQGVLVRVNWSLLTGPGVRAAFLDEVFKASGSLLNSLLMLLQERTYFNWGGMEKSDLAFLISASNELPGGFASGAFGANAAGGEDFQTLYAILDRFTLRLMVPTASGRSQADSLQSDLAKAFRIAIKRDARGFVTSRNFNERTADMPGINDLLLLGRAMLQHLHGLGTPCLFDKSTLKPHEDAFIRTAATLQDVGTDLSQNRISWTLSPRKLKALYKIALAHALVTDDMFGNQDCVVRLTSAHLAVFHHIWDTPEPLVEHSLPRLIAHEADRFQGDH